MRRHFCLSFTLFRTFEITPIKTILFLFFYSWKVISLRVLANFLIFLLLCFSAFAVVKVVERSENVKPDDSWWRQNEITLTLSLITTIFPNIFELIGMLENYHPRKQLRWQLARYVKPDSKCFSCSI